MHEQKNLNLSKKIDELKQELLLYKTTWEADAKWICLVVIPASILLGFCGGVLAAIILK